MSDVFEVLGLPARFDISPAEIERAYLAGVAACHPDLAGPDPERAAEAARRAAALNHAKATLSGPESRARALLKRLDADAGADERELPEGFLIEIMDARVGLEEAVAAGNRDEVNRFERWAAGERARYIERIAGIFRATEQGSAFDGREVRRQLNAWRYIERLLEQTARA